MALRSSWEGFLRLNLISVPIKAYSATVAGRGKIGFHMIHNKCNNRIRYQKVCPVHGEVPNDEIVSGYEVAKGQYVLVEKEELNKLKADADKSIEIDVFIKPRDLDPIFYTERTYYLTPDQKVGQKPYAVLHKVMTEEDRYAIATMVFAGREQVVLVRPMGRLIAATVLSFGDQIKKPGAFEDEVPDVSVAAEEVKLARTLVDASTDEKFDFSKYQDEYTGKVRKLIESRAGSKRRTVAPRGAEEPAIINLMDALRQSLHAARRTGNGKAHSRRTTAVAKGHRPARRRKTG